jgi:hypothetical protein
MKTLPDNFWMNSTGGPAGKGRWITTLMYTENETDANNFKEVLIRWNTKAQQTESQQSKSSDLIQINRANKN